MIEVDDKFKKEGQYGILWEDLLSNSDIEKIHSLSNNYESIRGKTLSENLSEYHRKSDVIWIPYNENSKWIYDKVTKAARNLNDEIYGFEIAGAQPFQYTIYNSEEEGEYDWHNDILSISKDTVRKLSVIILLSDNKDFYGGSFLVCPDGGKPKQIPMKKGRMIVFPSWIPHCVTPVLEGVRISLVMWLYGKRFK
jgi:PKHD-type hydroxylase